MKYLWIGLGGALGAIARYAVGMWVYEWVGERFGHFPYGTYIINMTGCFAIGLIVTVLDLRAGVAPAWRYAVPIGFIGAYTTFSTFELETLRAAQGGWPGAALLNVVLSIAVGYAAVWAGVVAGRHFA